MNRSSAAMHPARGIVLSRLVVASLVGAAATLPAQVPSNQALVGTIQDSTAPGASGLFFVSLPDAKGAGGGVITPLINVPADLVAPNSSFGGAFSVLRRPGDETVFVGNGSFGGNLYVHILKLRGPVIDTTTSTKVLVGTVPANETRIVGGLALLPDGRILVAAGPRLSSGPLANTHLGILDDSVTPPTLTPVTVSGTVLGPWMYDVKVWPDGRTAFFTTAAASTNLVPGHLYSVDLQTGVTRNLVTWANGFPPRLAMDDRGVLYTSCTDGRNASPARPTIHTIKVDSTGKPTVTSQAIDRMAGILGPALDAATGRFVFGVGPFNSVPSSNPYAVVTGDAAGVLKVLANPPASGWALPWAIDVHDALEPYGTTLGAAAYGFALFPNPGGLPEVGNGSFSLTFSAAAPPTVSLAFLGLRATDFVLLGDRILADPLVTLRIPAPAPNFTLPLPIPMDNTLRGVNLFAQGAHFDGQVWRTSRGLRVTVQ